MKPITPQRHSTTVGGSTAARVIACPASVRLCQKMPPMPTTDYAREGSLLHAAIAAVIEENLEPNAMIGFEHDGMVLDQDLYDRKLLPAVEAFDDLLDKLEEEMNDTATIMVEQEVDFGDFLPDAFGSCDVLIRCGDRMIVLDWKFGDGIAVSAEDNKQLMFYACAASRTNATMHMFEEARDVELVIIQPAQGEPSRWLTTFPELGRFEVALKAAVKESHHTNAPMQQGKHCKWCAAQPVCPLMNGALERAVKTDLSQIDVAKLGLAVQQSYILEDFIKKLRSLVQFALENGTEVPGCKLVEKRATRKWIDEEKAGEVMIKMVADCFMQTPEMAELLVYKQTINTPAQMEKLLSKHGMELPEDLIIKESSGTTMVPESDPRPSVNAKVNLVNALNKIK